LDHRFPCELSFIDHPCESCYSDPSDAVGLEVLRQAGSGAVPCEALFLVPDGRDDLLEVHWFFPGICPSSTRRGSWGSWHCDCVLGLRHSLGDGRTDAGGDSGGRGPDLEGPDLGIGVQGSRGVCSVGWVVLVPFGVEHSMDDEIEIPFVMGSDQREQILSHLVLFLAWL